MTPNQAAYDARYYDLNLDLNPATALVTGTVTVRAGVLAGPLNQAELDLADGMVVDAVRSGGLPTSFTHAGGILRATLDRAYETGEEFSVAVDYHGRPYGGWFAFDTYNGQPMIWSLSEAFGARSWWPCKDYPEDKADSVDIRIQVPSGLVTASNGIRVESTDDGHLAVTRWRERYPIATYLVSVAVHPYATYSDWFPRAGGDSMEIQFYIYPGQLESLRPINAKVKDMLGVLSSYFGEYPFIREKYGHAQMIWSGGAEHQTCTSIGAFDEWVVVHELAHQWWGDMVTCRTFNHFWLNEGFATYGEVLWAEANGGPTAAREDLSFNLYFGPGMVYLPDLDLYDPAREIDLYYNRASWVMHMLRGQMGDAAFFGALAGYAAAHRYGAATTGDFQAACETASGQDLDPFFAQWVYGEFYPRYRYDYTVGPRPGGGDLQLSLDQIQPGTPFNMPLDVVVNTAAGPRTFVVRDSLPSQVFRLALDAAPLSVSIDPDDWVLKTVEQPVVAPAFDRGVLVVNGLSWDVAGAEVRSAYQDRAFWGDYRIDFWDLFDEPAGGYPSTLPLPLGHGPPPRDVIGHYRNVIWPSDHNQGDVGLWLRSPIQSYLEAGGNLILLSRYGTHFITEWHRDYLGVNWADGTRIHDCLSTWPGLPNLRRLASMNACAVFDTVLLRPDSRLLYRVDLNYDPDRGVGVWRKPPGGGTHRPEGGQFIFLSGVPYRWIHADLRTAIGYMLQNFFGEPAGTSGVPGQEVGGPGAASPPPRLGAPHPNPFLDATTVMLELGRPTRVAASVLDVRGRLVRDLGGGLRAAGPHGIGWDGRDASGARSPGGIYWIRVVAEGKTLRQKVTKMP